MTKFTSLGPLMFDIAGLELTHLDREKLLHPLAGGVILFSRNFYSLAQLSVLTASIHELRTPPLLISVDHEGGRVQRFKEGFTVLPAMCELGKIWGKVPQTGKHLARELGYVLAAELRSCGVDFSFTPVLDIDYSQSGVIGDRALHSDPNVVFALAHDLIRGLKDGGMASVGKHFPGHGYVSGDSHAELPIDNRTFVDIEQSDLLPFRQLIHCGLSAIMPAYVVYPKVDSQPAGFSKIWITEILRKRMEFDGVVFSDDLNMEGAMIAGDILQRANAALTAGCDIVLICNNPNAVEATLDQFRWDISTVSLARMARMHGRPHPESSVQLRETKRHLAAIRLLSVIGVSDGELPFPA